MGPFEIASVALSRAQQRVETAAQNIANMTTPGYKAKRRFFDLIDAQMPALIGDRRAADSVDTSVGQLRNTGNPFDIALAGPGYFVVRSDAGTFYARNGKFHRDGEGRFVNDDGLVLQAEGGDLATNSATPSILSDGTVMDGGQPVARLSVVDFASTETLQPVGSELFAATDDAAAAATDTGVVQGAVETSNVAIADEMIGLMAALRGAESSQKVVQVYDDMLGRILTAFGQA
jgi:flagellar basal-body rod protein FlgG